MPARLPLLRLPLLIVLLVLSGLLLAAGVARASSPAPLATASAFEILEGEEEESEGEEEAGECEAAQEEVAEGEFSQAEADEICAEEAREEKRKKSGPGATAPEECVLRSSHAQATTSSQGEKLKLTIGYTAYAPADATLEVGHLATVHRHLGRSGVIRLVEDLHGRTAPKRLSVRIDIASAKSAGCPFRRLVIVLR